MWLTTAVAQAQGDGPGATPGLVSQVGKPVASQIAATTSSGATVAQVASASASNAAQQGASTASAAQQAARSVQAATVGQPAPKRVPAMTAPLADVPVPAPRIAVSTSPPPLPEASPAPELQAAPSVPPSGDLPATDTTPADELEAAADADGIKAVANADAPALPVASSAVEQVATLADPDVASSAVAQIDSVVEATVGPQTPGSAEVSTARAAADEIPAMLDTTPSALSTAITTTLPTVPLAPAALSPSIEPTIPTSPIAQSALSVSSTAGGPSEPDQSTPKSGPIAQFETKAARASLNAIGASIAGITADGHAAAAIATGAPIAAVVPDQLDTVAGLVPDDLRPSPAPSTAASANRLAVLGPVDSLRVGNVPAARGSLTDQLGPVPAAFRPPVLFAPTKALSFDAPRPHPSPEPTPFEALAPPDASAPPATSPSGFLAGSGGAPGAVSPLQLSLVLLTAWRSVWRQATSRLASIALPSLAPPG